MDWLKVHLVLFLMLMVGVSSSMAQDGCEEQPDGTVVCEFDDDAAGGSSSRGGDGSFWTSGTAQAIYAVLGLGVAVAGVVYAQQRLKSGRRYMYGYLRTVDQLLRKAKEDPDQTIPEMQRLRLEIQMHHEQAKLEDAQFLELDRRLSKGLLRSRILLLQRHFPQLPAALVNEIREVMSDEVFSRSDLDSLGQKARELQVPQAAREDLLTFLSGWLSTDPDAATITPAPEEKGKSHNI